MPDQPQPPASNRFKADMPQIPGVGTPGEGGSGKGGGSWLIAGGLLAVLLALLVGSRLLSKPRRTVAVPAPAAQIDVPADVSSPVPDLPVPVATESNPVIARVGELQRG